MLQRVSLRLSPLTSRAADVAPVAPACCNACRTCAATNIVGLLLLGTGAVAAGLSRLGRRFVQFS